MSSILNRPESKDLRADLRKRMTRAEKALWKALRGSRLMGLRFRRQYGIHEYVVDFYCPSYKLEIEVIGDVHGTPLQEKRDQRRKARIEALGIKMLCYTNGQVINGIEGVLEDIIANLPPTPSFIRRGR